MRLIDTASAYGNEEEVGQAVREAMEEQGIQREQRTRTALTIEETASVTMSDLVKRFYQADCSGSHAKTEVDVQTLTGADMAPIREDLIGCFVAVLPARQMDIGPFPG